MSPLRLVAALALGAVACTKPDAAADTKVSSATASASAAATTATSAAPAAGSVLDDVPVAEDYIEEATKQIDKANYKSELERLKKDIESGK